MFREYLKTYADDAGYPLTDECLDAFTVYYHTLVEWNEKMNLTAITEPREVALKHMIDSLTVYKKDYFPEGASVIDVGTGAGFPGLPLAIYQPHLSVVLLDSLKKRLTFLEETLKLCGRQAELVHARAEDAGRDSKHRDSYDAAVSRGVARLYRLVEWCLPFVKVGGVFLAMKGAKCQEEVDEAKKAIFLLGGKVEAVHEVSLPELDDKRAIVVIRKVSPTPKTYPRRPAVAEKKPLL
ncbi:MAG: 16S rRNA (guanine(527)-N(7))-methyltransferase RsmG [Selenomonadales bacterium]|nr:16S rRNA (guanine(527)-N(7))-methyltransferase RsmG [Selenomonadales bacterium]